MELEAQRPAPADVRDVTTVRRWYWLRSELVDIARHNGVRTSGGKLELTERICAYLDHRPPPSAAVRARSRDELPAELTTEVLLQEGQRCTQQLRTWMRAQVGSAFVFYGPMRSAVRAGGMTLGDLVTLWYATRNRPPNEIGPQFELNRFSRAWHNDNPHGTHAGMLAAWATHRNTPRAGRS